VVSGALDDASVGHRVAEGLRARGMVRGILVQMAEREQIIELRCEMPKCFCPKGRAHFDPKSTPMTAWAPNADHYPILKRAGGKLRADNVRLAHVRCNNTDAGWRLKIKAMLAKGMSLQQIADKLTRQKVPRPHGAVSWTARNVRRAFVS
jgi:hypothetical protein